MFEVSKQEAWFDAEHGQRGVVAHGVGGFDSILQHGHKGHVEFFLGITEGSLLLGKRQDIEVSLQRLGSRIGQSAEFHAIGFQPVAIRMPRGEGGLDLRIETQGAGFEVDADHFTWREASFADDGVVVQFYHADFRSESENSLFR